MAEGCPTPLALVFMLFAFSAWALDFCPGPCSCTYGQDDALILDCNWKRMSTPTLDPPAGITQV